MYINKFKSINVKFTATNFSYHLLYMFPKVTTKLATDKTWSIYSFLLFTIGLFYNR